MTQQTNLAPNGGGVGMKEKKVWNRFGHTKCHQSLQTESNLLGDVVEETMWKIEAYSCPLKSNNTVS
jgi:hypothetical protein